MGESLSPADGGTVRQQAERHPCEVEGGGHGHRGRDGERLPNALDYRNVHQREDRLLMSKRCGRASTMRAHSFVVKQVPPD